MKANDLPFDYRTITDTIQRSLAAAGLQRESGVMKGVTSTVEQALTSAGLIRGERAPGGRTFEGTAREVDPIEVGGEFVTRSFSNGAGARSYKLYVPASHSPDGEPGWPLVVMLHGCSQTPDDFAAGTRMNALAERHGFVVAYPAQAAQANKSRCWKWYSAADQAREQGEPAILAGIVGDVMAQVGIDPDRVFVAGMSAGAAMAVILGTTYPEIFAAVGAHSGLPYGAAQDVGSAFAAMKGGAAPRAARAIPTIVFHGDRDTTVNASNGAAIAEQAVQGSTQAGALRREAQRGRSADGRAYSRTVHADATDRAVVEHWVVAGSGHAWSGGSPDGSFTDAGGPDASAEMIRFFLQVGYANMRIHRPPRQA